MIDGYRQEIVVHGVMIGEASDCRERLQKDDAVVLECPRFAHGSIL
jgi:hypothetical protein